MDDILARIVAVKRDEVAAGRRVRDTAAVRRAADSGGAPRDFTGALQARVAGGAAAVIAEINERNGAAALSVLTDERFFQGSAAALAAARSACGLPVLRKDFVI